jgi:hypothetical protein
MADIDTFLNTAQTDTDREIQDDIQVSLLTRTNSQFFNRTYGNSITLHENESCSAAEQMLLKYEIALCLARRNAAVPKRLQAAASQGSIAVERTADALNIDVAYIPVEHIKLNTMSVSLNLSSFS